MRNKPRKKKESFLPDHIGGYDILEWRAKAMKEEAEASKYALAVEDNAREYRKNLAAVGEVSDRWESLFRGEKKISSFYELEAEKYKAHKTGSAIVIIALSIILISVTIALAISMAR